MESHVTTATTARRGLHVWKSPAFLIVLVLGCLAAAPCLPDDPPPGDREPPPPPSGGRESPGVEFLRGDANQSGLVNEGDVLFLLAYFMLLWDDFTDTIAIYEVAELLIDDFADYFWIDEYLQGGHGIPPACFDAADANDDGYVNLNDPVFILNALNNQGLPGFFIPGMFCAADSTEDDLPECIYRACSS